MKTDNNGMRYGFWVNSDESYWVDSVWVNSLAWLGWLGQTWTWTRAQIRWIGLGGHEQGRHTNRHKRPAEPVTRKWQRRWSSGCYRLGMMGMTMGRWCRLAEKMLSWMVELAVTRGRWCWWLWRRLRVGSNEGPGEATLSGRLALLKGTCLGQKRPRKAMATMGSDEQNVSSHG